MHNGLRRWVELRPDAAVCGSTSIQLFEGGGGSFEVDAGNSVGLEALRGCSLTITGRLGIPGTGYYSAPFYMNVDRKQPDKGCVPQPPIPNYWHAKPDANVKRYRVHMTVDYKGEGSVSATATAGSRSLQPWQAYANYFVTSEFVIWINCAKGYDLSNMSATPAAHPEQTDNNVSIDPDGAAEKGVWKTHADFTCSR